MPALPLPPPDAPVPGARRGLSRRAKAAIVVQFLLKEGADIPLDSLPPALQAELTQQLGSMRSIDRDTLREVMREFADEIDRIGLRFPGELSGALRALEGRVDPRTARALRRSFGSDKLGDPWQVLTSLPTDRLLELAQSESAEVAAVLLSKLDTDRAADLLGKLPGDRARRIAYAVSLTANVTPEAVLRIGRALLEQLDAEPDRAFSTRPEDRIGAILNSAPSDTREALLEGLDRTDADFGRAVRAKIFIFANIPERVDPLDVPKIVRVIAQETLIAALGGARSAADRLAADFVLDNMSKRMAETLRAEIADAQPPDEETADRARSEIVSALRRLADGGEIALKPPKVQDEPH